MKRIIKICLSAIVFLGVFSGVITVNANVTTEYYAKKGETILKSPKANDVIKVGTSNKKTANATIDKEVDWNKQALKSARFWKSEHYSRNGIVRVMTEFGHPSSAIDYAMKQIDKETDWNQQAVNCAKDCLRWDNFSKEGLQDWLIDEGFTVKQAQYGTKVAFE